MIRCSGTCTTHSSQLVSLYWHTASPLSMTRKRRAHSPFSALRPLGPWGRPGGEDSVETSAPSRFLSFALPVTECVVQRQGIVTTILYYCYAHTHTHAQTQRMRPSSCLLSVEVFAGQILIGTHTGTCGTHRVLGNRAGNAPLGRSTDRVRSLSEHTCRVSVESATQRLRTRQNHG